MPILTNPLAVRSAKKVLPQSELRKAFKSKGYANAKKMSRGDLRDDRPPHGRFLASMP